MRRPRAPTIGEALAALDDRLFVGRARELAAFGTWLNDAAAPPAILNVSGPGGVGKSALLAAFGREAAARGLAVRALDGREVRATPAGFLGALGGGGLAAVLARLAAERALLLLDSVEDLANLTRFLQAEFLPGLATGVRVVIAGRTPLGAAWAAGPWRGPIRPLPLAGLAPAEGREYLVRRGIHDGLPERILAAAGGLPLALALAADLALQLGVRDFAAVGEWRLAVRALVERLVRHLPDPAMRAALEAAAIVRAFDEATLAALLGREDGGAAFERLCGLSMVRPAEHGLALHDEVRRFVAEDLRWRRPDHADELRLRALAHYRARMAAAPPGEREWLLGERLYLWENAFARALLFPDWGRGDPWVEDARPEDRPELLTVWDCWLRRILPTLMHLTVDVAYANGIVAGLLAYPASRVRVARDRDGRARGFDILVPVCRESLPLIDSAANASTLLRAYWGTEDLTGLPAGPAETDVHWLAIVAHTDEGPEATQAALLRDLLGALGRGGVCLANTPIPAYRRLLETLGFEPVPEARTWLWSDVDPTDGYVLDLGRIGVDAWFEALIAGRPVPRPLRPAELERALQDALPHWRDDNYLASSPLARLPAVRALAEDDCPAAAVRELVLQTLRRARGDPERKAALRALELGYLTPGLSHERAAERLAVSRATFYRLLKRGVADLADALQPA